MEACPRLPFPPLWNTERLQASHIEFLCPPELLQSVSQTQSVMFFKFICAVVTRSLFILVSLTGVWRVVWVKNNGLYWFLTILYLPLVVEMILTLKRRKGNDYKWYELLNSSSLFQDKYVYNI